MQQQQQQQAPEAALRNQDEQDYNYRQDEVVHDKKRHSSPVNSIIVDLDNRSSHNPTFYELDDDDIWKSQYCMVILCPDLNVICDV